MPKKSSKTEEIVETEMLNNLADENPTNEEIIEAVAEFQAAMLVDEIAPEDGETEVPAKYATMFERLTPGMGIFESIDDPKRFIKKNMALAKLVNGVYQFNGYFRAGRPENFKLIKKKQ
jgi:hypothetical protein